MITLLLILFLIFRSSLSSNVQFSINNLCLAGGLIGLIMQYYINFDKKIPKNIKYKKVLKIVLFIIATISHLFLIFGALKCNQSNNYMESFIFGFVMFIGSIALKVDLLYMEYGAPEWMVRYLPLPLYAVILYSNIINKISC